MFSQRISRSVEPSQFFPVSFHLTRLFFFVNLKVALNIPPGAPPPWLINMQRYGPPPSYPNMKIPGLNCPIPDT